MCRESACGFVYTVSAEISIVSVNSGSVILSLGSLWHVLLVRSIAFHELRCKMTWPKAKYANRISAQKRVDQDLPSASTSSRDLSIQMPTILDARLAVNSGRETFFSILRQ